MSLLYYLAAFMSGVMTALMVFCNSELGVATDSNVSIIVNQIVGIVILASILLVFRRNKTVNPLRRPARWYLYLSGLYGVVIITAGCIAMPEVGVSLFTASEVLGQSLASVVFDLTGLMGLKKRRISLPKALCLLLSLVGIIVMGLSGGQFKALYILVGILAGCAITTQMVFNASFARSKGPFFGALVNVLTGLAGGVVLAAVTSSRGTLEAFGMLESVSPWIVLGGGAIGAVTVVTANTIIPRIPVVYSTLLMSSAQLLTSLLVDKLFTGLFSVRTLYGSLLVLVGIIGSILIDARHSLT